MRQGSKLTTTSCRGILLEEAPRWPLLSRLDCLCWQLGTLAADVKEKKPDVGGSCSEARPEAGRSGNSISTTPSSCQGNCWTQVQKTSICNGDSSRHSHSPSAYWGTGAFLILTTMPRRFCHPDHFPRSRCWRVKEFVFEFALCISEPGLIIADLTWGLLILWVVDGHGKQEFWRCSKISNVAAACVVIQVVGQLLRKRDKVGQKWVQS